VPPALAIDLQVDAWSNYAFNMSQRALTNVGHDLFGEQLEIAIVLFGGDSWQFHQHHVCDASVCFVTQNLLGHLTPILSVDGGLSPRDGKLYRCTTRPAARLSSRYR